MRFDFLTKAWYQPKLTLLTALLLPLAALFAGVVALRRYAYRRAWLRVTRLPVPVIVVGNITIGGTGKTPTVIALALFLKSQGYRVGIISRGVGVKRREPWLVNANTSPHLAGDEAVLIAKRTECPVVVFPDRIAGAHFLLKQSPCDLILSDDGLQHYRLQPDITIALMDAKRQLGNRFMLPAGPLREPASRLAHVNFVLTTGRDVADIRFQAEAWCSVTGDQTQTLTAFSGQKAHVMAGISNPQAFFECAARVGVQGIPHSFQDHQAYTEAMLNFTPRLPLLMTEKDAVKCSGFSIPDMWYLSQTAILPDFFKQAILHQLKGVLPREAKIMPA
ncbi:MAG TPA: tetraacyldisaccharide 4'-kinase [Gammaproteobacteria bacterium]|jgi:tetraacyldisaccharide 4'-kinase|nr:tetraacyldisaccharide 4'-kinase [Gammaproteobacteria bacterium]